MNTGYVDIHCHILPGIDDGSPSLADSLDMARMASADGVATIIATPHADHEYPPRPALELVQRVADLQRAIDGIGVPLRILPGADVQIVESLCQRVQSREILTLADTGRYILLELPHDIYVPIEGLMADLQKIGVRSILSHPERNVGIQSNLKLLPALVQRGCLLQVTAGSILGEFGREPKLAALAMLRQRLVHFVASDAHSPRRRKPLLHDAWRAVTSSTDEAYADRIFKHLPAAVALGKPLPASASRPPARPANRSLLARIFG